MKQLKFQVGMSDMRYLFILIMLVLFLFGAFATQTYAQTTQVDTSAQPEEKQVDPAQNEGDEEAEFLDVETRTGDPLIAEILGRARIKNPDFSPVQIPSLLFTSWEQALIEEAREGLVARPATDSEVRQAEEWQKDGTRPPRGPREISLGGIVYVSHGDWTVWINNQRVTPDAIPPEVLDIHVHKGYIKIKWFDAYTNQIFPIKIRPHQRFNIDTRIFLPG